MNRITRKNEKLNKTKLLFFIKILLCFSILIVISCSENTQKNNPPAQPVIEWEPKKIIPGIEVTLIAVSTDPDGDSLFYIWKATAGEFPYGYVAKTAIWQAPDLPSSVKITVSVTDKIDTSSTTITLKVEGEAEIYLDADTLIINQDDNQKEFSIKNTGNDYLDFKITSHSNWLKISPSIGNLKPDEIAKITVTGEPEKAGDGIHYSQIYITGNDTLNDSLFVIFDVSLPPIKRDSGDIAHINFSDNEFLTNIDTIGSGFINTSESGLCIEPEPGFFLFLCSKIEVAGDFKWVIDLKANRQNEPEFGFQWVFQEATDNNIRFVRFVIYQDSLYLIGLKFEKNKTQKFLLDKILNSSKFLKSYQEWLLLFSCGLENKWRKYYKSWNTIEIIYASEQILIKVNEIFCHDSISIKLKPIKEFCIFSEKGESCWLNLDLFSR